MLKNKRKENYFLFWNKYNQKDQIIYEEKYITKMAYCNRKF